MAGQAWTRKEMDSLVTQVMVHGKKLPQLVIPGRTFAAINRLMVYLRRSGRLNDRLARKNKSWTAEEIRQLKQCAAAGDSALSIYRSGVFGERQRSVNSISQKMRRLDLGNPEIKEKAKNARRLTNQESRNFNSFLLADGGKMLTKEIACIWPLTPKAIRRRRRKLAVHLDWHQSRGLKK
jgi:hypothetical protein